MLNDAAHHFIDDFFNNKDDELSCDGMNLWQALEVSNPAFEAEIGHILRYEKDNTRDFLVVGYTTCGNYLIKVLTRSKDRVIIPAKIAKRLNVGDCDYVTIDGLIMLISEDSTTYINSNIYVYNYTTSLR